MNILGQNNLFRTLIFNPPVYSRTKPTLWYLRKDLHQSPSRLLSTAIRIKHRCWRQQKCMWFQPSRIARSSSCIPFCATVHARCRSVNNTYTLLFLLLQFRIRFWFLSGFCCVLENMEPGILWLWLSIYMLNVAKVNAQWSKTSWKQWDFFSVFF